MTYKKSSSTNMLNETYLEERCTLNKVLRIIGKRWVSEILVLVKNDINRFSQLKECMNGISDNVLASVLNQLVTEGLIDKKIFNEVPLRVEYHITQSGLDLTVLLLGLCSWGKQQIPYEIRMTPSSLLKRGATKN